MQIIASISFIASQYFLYEGVGRSVLQYGLLILVFILSLSDKQILNYTVIQMEQLRNRPFNKH